MSKITIFLNFDPFIFQISLHENVVILPGRKSFYFVLSPRLYGDHLGCPRKTRGRRRPWGWSKTQRRAPSPASSSTRSRRRPRPEPSGAEPSRTRPRARRRPCSTPLASGLASRCASADLYMGGRGGEGEGRGKAAPWMGRPHRLIRRILCIYLCRPPPSPCPTPLPLCPAPRLTLLFAFTHYFCILIDFQASRTAFRYYCVKLSVPVESTRWWSGIKRHADGFSARTFDGCCG